MIERSGVALLFSVRLDDLQPIVKSWAVSCGVEEFLNVSSSIPLAELSEQLEARITSVLSVL